MIKTAEVHLNVWPSASDVTCVRRTPGRKVACTWDLGKSNGAFKVFEFPVDKMYHPASYILDYPSFLSVYVFVSGVIKENVTCPL